MSMEEARHQLDLIDHDFYLFRDRDSGELQVIYRRNHGGYGVIQARTENSNPMADPRQDLPDLPPLLDHALLDPVLNGEQLIERCDASRERNIRAICCARLPATATSTGGWRGPTVDRRHRLSLRHHARRTAAGRSHGPPPTAPTNWTWCPISAPWPMATPAASPKIWRLISDLGLPLRVVLDMARLSDGQLELAVEAAIDAGASGVQTGNGFGPPAIRIR